MDIHNYMYNVRTNSVRTYNLPSYMYMYNYVHVYMYMYVIILTTRNFTLSGTCSVVDEDWVKEGDSFTIHNVGQKSYLQNVTHR